MKLGHILQSSIPVHIELDRYGSEELKRAARFWVGQGSGFLQQSQVHCCLNPYYER